MAVVAFDASVLVSPPEEIGVRTYLSEVFFQVGSTPLLAVAGLPGGAAEIAELVAARTTTESD